MKKIDNIFLTQKSFSGKYTIKLPASKSESNRALVINALAGNKGVLKNLSNARDTQIMQSLLKSRKETWDAQDAGTTMRFLTAYASVTEERVMTGTDRMKERPIGVLTEALKTLGATIYYLENEGYPPHRIIPIEKQQVDMVKIRGDISSQYISALMMIAPSLPDGLQIAFTSQVNSIPYIKMTAAIMKNFGVESTWSNNVIQVLPQKYIPATFEVENDWSAVSYWYALAALNPDLELHLPGLKTKSHQGDQAIVEIMLHFGVDTTYTDDGITIKRTKEPGNYFTYDFRDCPDLAQTVMAVAAALAVSCSFTGLESLKIKETDRIAAMQNELGKIGTTITEEGSIWHLKPGLQAKWEDEISFSTYEDHRMAMALAPLCSFGAISIQEPGVVAKSYPDYWGELKALY